MEYFEESTVTYNCRGLGCPICEIFNAEEREIEFEESQVGWTKWEEEE